MFLTYKTVLYTGHILVFIKLIKSFILTGYIYIYILIRPDGTRHAGCGTDCRQCFELFLHIAHFWFN